MMTAEAYVSCNRARISNRATATLLAITIKEVPIPGSLLHRHIPGRNLSTRHPATTAHQVALTTLNMPLSSLTAIQVMPLPQPVNMVGKVPRFQVVTDSKTSTANTSTTNTAELTTDPDTTNMVNTSTAVTREGQAGQAELVAKQEVTGNALHHPEWTTTGLLHMVLHLSMTNIVSISIINMAGHRNISRVEVATAAATTALHLQRGARLVNHVG